MTPSERLASVADQLRRNETIQPVTVRQFLAWFNALRRGYWIVLDIRKALEEHNLKTEPDFESEYIDSPINFALTEKERSPLEVTHHAVELSATAVVTSTMVATLSVSTAYADPTYRISKLAAANKTPLQVTPDATLAEAATKMLTHGYSQLPVMTSSREVKGVISWSSIASRLALGKMGASVREMMDQPQELRADASIFQAIPVIVQHQYVLVRGADNQISGIVTASDLSLQFQQLAEPFLLLGEIENHVRRLIGSKFDVAELGEALDPGVVERKIVAVSDLNFGEYIRLLEHLERWTKLGLAVDRKTFCKQLDRIREIRNDVMHFDPDGISPADLDTLREFARFLQHLQSIGIS